MSYLKSASSNRLKCNVLCNTKRFSSFRPKLPYWVVLSCNFEKLLTFDISTLEVVKTESFMEKKRNKSWTKNALSEYFWTGISKSIVIFKIITLELVKLENSCKIKNPLNLGPKMPYL